MKEITVVRNEANTADVAIQPETGSRVVDLGRTRTSRNPMSGKSGMRAANECISASQL
jgi:hypothetical protein